MSVSSIGGGASNWPVQNSGSATWQQNQQNFQQLASALQSGNLGQAQSAYSSLTANLPNGGNGSGSQSNSPFAQLGQALQSGNLQSAQQASQTLQSHHSGHHHRHGGGGGESSGADASTSTSASSNSGGTVGSLLDTTA
ncbi:hypothetical protein [Chromobacterium subtsugae]|uniref:hypothetical protein n=1 Tax=Chromobacterium subtsugae TaxID=251747 RepID=UPI00069A3BE1|nr:hypothetical protein [Chromobacterium subtsugae]